MSKISVCLANLRHALPLGSKLTADQELRQIHKLALMTHTELIH